MKFSEFKFNRSDRANHESIARILALCDALSPCKNWSDYNDLKRDLEEKKLTFGVNESIDLIALCKVKECLLSDDQNNFRMWREDMELDQEWGMDIVPKLGVYDWSKDQEWLVGPEMNPRDYVRGGHMFFIHNLYEKNHFTVKASKGDVHYVNKPDCQVWITTSPEMRLVLWEIDNAQRIALMKHNLMWDGVSKYFPEHESNMPCAGYISDRLIGTDTWFRENLREGFLNLTNSVMVDELFLSSISKSNLLHCAWREIEEQADTSSIEKFEFLKDKNKKLQNVVSRAEVNDNRLCPKIKIECKGTKTFPCSDFPLRPPAEIKKKNFTTFPDLVQNYIWFLCFWVWMNTGRTFSPCNFKRGKFRAKTISEWTKNGMKMIFICSFALQASARFCSDAGGLEPCMDPAVLITAPTYNVEGEVVFVFDSIKSILSFQPGNFSDFRCYISEVRSAVCETYVSRNMTDFVNCDTNFMSTRGCSTEPRNCFCESGKNLVVEMDRYLNEISFHDLELIGVERSEESISAFSVSNQNGPWNYTHHYNKEKNRYEFRTNNLDKKTVLIRKRACFDTKHNVTSKVNIDLGECFQKSIGSVYVTVMNGSTVVDTHTFRMKEYRRCDDYPAMFSTKTNFHCHDTDQQVLYVFFWILFGIACLTLILALLSSIKPTYEMIKKGYCALKKNITKRRNKNKSKKMERERNIEEEESEQEKSSSFEVDIEEDRLPMRKEKVTPKKKFRGSLLKKLTTNTNLVTLLKISLMMTGCMACDLVVFTDSSVTSCSMNTVTNTLDCVPNQMIAINFDYAGQTVCVNIQDSKNNTMETYKLTLDYVKVFLLEGECYHTADWTLSTQTHLRCKATSDCDTGVCGSISYGPDHSMGGQISNPNCLVFPGEGACEVHDTSNPFTCGSAENCYYWCAAIVPEDFSNRFCMIDGYATEERITVKDNSDSYLTTFDFGNIVPFPNGQIEFHGLFSLDFDNILPSYYNIYSDQYITVGSERGFPEINKIGDVQGNDQSSSSTGDFIYANGVITGHYKDDATDEIVVSFLESGFSHNNAPKIHSGNTVLEVWNYNETLARWEALVTRTVGAQFSVILDGSYMVSEQLNEVCPVIEDVTDAAGCYDCDSGMSFNITAHSQCLSGSALISCDGVEILNPLVDLIDSEREFEIFGLFDEARVSVDCKIGDKEFHLNGELSEIEDFDKSVNNVTTSNDNKENDACEGDFVAKTFNGCGKWYDILGTVLLLIALTGALIVCFLVIVYLFSQLFEMISIYSILRQSRNASMAKSVEPSERLISLEEKAKTEKLSWSEAREMSQLRKKAKG